MLLTRNSGRKDRGFVLIDKDFLFFFIINNPIQSFFVPSIILLGSVLAYIPMSVPVAEVVCLCLQIGS
ncbi:hypothetical protein F7887_17500 [Bacteroides fragilis]|nr:hypothetical protein F7887_17500 [Bacteroides fragilis]RHH72503.1 hypothetical protein DW198_01795 [Bacteroides fragilis]